ncbi:MAG: response regulator transcription factor [Chitinophagaceae bacterium]|nr:response regulator transcription factor [Chitinophagaceae bacterium]
MSNKAQVLVIDDEPQIRKLLEITLESNGYEVSLAATAKEGIIIAANHPPDAIILDLGLPDESGHEVLIKLREWYINPVIILSVQSNEDDIVKALDNGANDYLVKPFRTGELLARIRSSLRIKISEENNPLITCGEMEFNLSARIVKKNNIIIKLTATEYTLISLMVKNEGKVLTHQYLLREVWGPGYINQSQYLRVFIAQLRKKIENDANHPEYIITESGVGYRFVCKE